MINRTFVIAFSIGCLLAMLVFNRPAGLMPSGRDRILQPDLLCQSDRTRQTLSVPYRLCRPAMTAGAPCQSDANRFPTRYGQNAGPFPRKKRPVPSRAKHPIVRWKPPRQRQVPACSGRFPPGHAVFRHDGRKPPFSPPYTGQSGPCRLHASVTKKDGNVPGMLPSGKRYRHQPNKPAPPFPPAISSICHRTNHPAGHQQPFDHFRPKKMAHQNGAPSIPKNTVQFDTSSKSIS